MRVLEPLPPEAWRSYQRATFPEGSWVREMACSHGGGGGAHGPPHAPAVPAFRTPLEWRVARGGKSGVLYRVTEALPHAWQRGLDIQLLDDAHHRTARRRRPRLGPSMG